MRLYFVLPFLIGFATIAAADDIAPMALNSIGTVPAKITGAKVMDSHGVVVGAVARIETDVMGKPLKVDITLTDGRPIALDTSALGYDQNANVLVTAMDQKQLAQMAPAPRH